MRLERKLISASGSRIVIMKARTAAEPLADHTTLRVGGPARRMITVATEAELIEAVRDLDASAEPVLVLGGGSNVLSATAASRAQCSRSLPAALRRRSRHAPVR